MFDKLRHIEERSQEIARALSDPAIFSRQAEYARLRKNTPTSKKPSRAFASIATS